MPDQTFGALAVKGFNLVPPMFIASPWLARIGIICIVFCTS